MLTFEKLLEFPELREKTAKIQQLFEKIPNFPYEAWVKPLLHRHLEFLQSLPETHSAHHSNPRGALHLALDRSLTATHLCHTLLLSTKELEASSARFHLWIYVLFSAAMFHRLGALTLKIHVELFHHQQELGSWFPLTGTMLQNNATHYEYSFVEKNFEYLGLKITPLLARQIMPLAGFSAIASDPEALGVWLALLEEEWEQVGSFSNLIPISQSAAVYDFFVKLEEKIEAEEKKEREKKEALQEDFALIKDEKKDKALGAKAGADFLAWLKSSVDKNHVKTHGKDAHVHLTDHKEHVFIDHHHLLKEYKDHHPKAADAKKILKSLAKMGVLVKNPQGSYTHSAKIADGGSKKGLIVSTYYSMSPETAREKANNPLSMQSLAKIVLAQIRPHHHHSMHEDGHTGPKHRAGHGAEASHKAGHTAAEKTQAPKGLFSSENSGPASGFKPSGGGGH